MTLTMPFRYWNTLIQVEVTYWQIVDMIAIN